MRRLALCVLLLLLLLAMATAMAALAQDTEIETVTIHGSSLVGVWHGTLGQSGFRGPFGALGMTPAKLGQMTLVHCRIAPAADELEMSCLQFGSMGRVTVTEGLVRIGSSRLAFEGEQPDVNRLRGHFRSRSWLGLSQDNPLVAEAVRVVPQVGAPETGKAELLRQILEQGLSAVPRDAEGLKKNGSRLTLPKTGPVQGIAYLGQETKWDWPPPPGTKADIMNLPSRPDFFSVYWVDFAEGGLLCGLHQRDDGVLDAFGCV